MPTIYKRSSSGEVFQTSHPEYHKDSVTLTAKEGKVAFQKYHAAQLRKLIKPGSTVYCILRHVSASGMSRRISLCIVQPASKGSPAIIRTIDYAASIVMGYSTDRSKGEGITVGGCGMDMGFQLVYTLGQYLWPKGTKKPHGTRNGQPDSDGGYALKHHWL